MEIWKTIPEFSHYEASNYGRIRNVSGHIMKQRLNGTRENNKYWSVNLMKDGNEPWRLRHKLLSVHRLVLKAFKRILNLYP